VRDDALGVLGVGFGVWGSHDGSILCEDKFRYVHSPILRLTFPTLMNTFL